MPNYPYTFQLPPLNVQDIPNDGVAGEFLGISAGGVLDWLPVATGGGDMLKADNLSGLASYPTARTNLGLGTGDSPTFANLTLTSPSLSSSAPVTISQTWSTTGTYTAFKVVANETATANTLSNVLELWSGNAATLKLSIRKSGQIVGPSGTIAAPTYGFADTDWGTGFSGWYRLGTGVACSTAGGTVSAFSITHTNIRIGTSIPFGWTSGTAENALDTILLRDGAANTLALRNGANAQTFNVYGSYGSISDYKRLSISCDQTTGNATITNQAAGYTAGTVSINGVPVGLGKGNVSSNVAVGTGALSTNATGADNVAVGFEALGLGTAGSESVAVGWRAAKGSSVRHVSIGYGANQLGATDSVSIGWASMFNLAGGSLNVAVGRSSGYFITGGSTHLTSCTKSLFLGCDTKALGQSQENQIVIGYDATGIGSNSVVLGNDSITKTALKGNVGIGTTAPASALHISGALGSNITTYDSAAALKLTNTTGNSSWLLTSGVIGVVNASFSIRRDSVALHALTISGTDNFGIGTTSPTSKLHVAGDVTLPNGGSIFFGGGYNIYGTTTATQINGPTSFGQVAMSVNGVIKWLFNYDGLLCGGGTTAAFPALKRSSTTVQARLADDTAFAPIQGKLTTDTAYTATVVAATGYITIYDSTGTAYRVPCAV